VLAKYIFIANFASLLVTSVLRVVLILTNADVIWFGWAMGLSAVVSGIALLACYWMQGESVRAWKATYSEAKYLLLESWPLILSNLGAVLYLKIGQVMLGAMAGNSEVGIYAAAARLSEIWYFIPTAVASSVFPMMVQRKLAGAKSYDALMQNLYDYSVWMALVIVIPWSALSGVIIPLLLGAEYARSVPILSIQVFACIFIFPERILSRWLIAEGYLNFSFIRHGVGAVVYILLGFALIPAYGGMGAAITTIVAYAAASYLSCFLYPKTWSAGKMMTLALISPIRVPVRYVLGRMARS
jgi:O-antigen/teichoic acid export membrane protein